MNLNFSKYLVGLCLLALSVSTWAGQSVDPTKSAQKTAKNGQTILRASDSDLQPTEIQGPGLVDDFNRVDGPIGGDWVTQAGTFTIVSNAARGSGTALATYPGLTSNVLEADVTASSGGLAYVGLALDYADLGNVLFLKVQGSGNFSDAACYYGNNGSEFGLGFFDLTETFTTAHMRVEVVGSTVTMTFSHIDGGNGVQEYVCTGAPQSGGTGVGIVGYAGQASLDNFSTDNGSIVLEEALPVPATSFTSIALFCLLLLITGLGILTRKKHQA